MEEPGIIIESINVIGQLSYWGIFGLSLLANLVIPVPEEIFLLGIGYLSGGDAPVLNPYITAVIIIPGLLISDIFLYSLAKQGNKYVAILERRLRNFKFTRDREFVERHILKIIFISRFVIQFRFVGPVLAGTTNISWKKFLLWDFLALCVYVPLVIATGIFFHARITQVINGIGVVKNYILLGVGLLIFIWLVKLIRRHFFAYYVFKIDHEEGYIDTLIPGIKKRIVSIIHNEEDVEGQDTPDDSHNNPR